MSACQTFSFILPDAEYISQNGDRHTIRYTYGSAPEKDYQKFRDSYDKKLAEKASEVCNSKAFEILEKGRKPSTVENLKNISEYDFFWVFRCKE